MNYLYPMTDPAMWVIPLIVAAAGFAIKQLLEIWLWLLTRNVYNVPGADKAYRDTCVKEIEQAPGTILKLIVARSALKRLRHYGGISEGQYLTKATLESGPGVDLWVEGESGELFAVQVKRYRRKSGNGKSVRVRSHSVRNHLRAARPPLTHRLTRVFTTFGQSVIGGSEGADFAEQWSAELREITHPILKISYAFSNAVGAFKIHWMLRTRPLLQRWFSTPIRATNNALDRIAASEFLSSLVIGGPALLTVLIPAFIIGGLGLAFGTLIAAWVPITARVHKWRHRRLRARRKAQIGTG